MKRRHFLRNMIPASAIFPSLVNGFTVKAFGAAGFFESLAGAADNDHVFVVIQLAGGNDGLNTVVPIINYGDYLNQRSLPHAECSLVLAAYRAGIPCTIHVALGTDIVHMHPHVSGAALGEASLLDFRHLCNVVATLEQGVWLNFGSAVMLPEVLLKAVSVVRNFGHNLDGLVTVNVDKESRYRSTVNVLNRPAAEGIELTGHHEILLPLLHAAVACRLAEQGEQQKMERAA